MAIAHEASKPAGWLSTLMTTDFCPWANRFVYWLKEPIGWFVLATAVSVIVGLYLNPIGWTLAASLTAIMLVGMAWPLLAIHVTACQLRPETDCIHEDDCCRMIVSVRNRVPIPVWGLAIEGYLDSGHPSNADSESAHDDALPTVGLACVPPLCISDFGITTRPSLRGRYPMQTPQVSCSFPFGIWTARRKLTTTSPLVVWPKLFSISGTCPIVGGTHARHGEGNRGGRSGDFTGARAYRQGDSARHINWVASARVDSLIVTERSDPQCVTLNVSVDARHCGTREQLADRIRIAASVLVNLHQANVPMRITVGGQLLRITPEKTGRSKGRQQILDAMTDIPVDGIEHPFQQNGIANAGQASIEFTSDSDGHTIVRVIDPRSGRRSGGGLTTKQIRSGERLADRLRQFWMEVRDGGIAA